MPYRTASPPLPDPPPFDVLAWWRRVVRKATVCVVLLYLLAYVVARFDTALWVRVGLPSLDGVGAPSLNHRASPWPERRVTALDGPDHDTARARP